MPLRIVRAASSTRRMMTIRIKRSGAGRKAARSAIIANDSRNQIVRLSLCLSCSIVSLQSLAASCLRDGDYPGGKFEGDRNTKDISQAPVQLPFRKGEGTAPSSARALFFGDHLARQRQIAGSDIVNAGDTQ